MIMSTVLAYVPYVWPRFLLAPLSIAGKHVLSPQMSKDMTSFFPFLISLNKKEGKRHDMLMATSGMDNNMLPKLRTWHKVQRNELLRGKIK